MMPFGALSPGATVALAVLGVIVVVFLLGGAAYLISRTIKNVRVNDRLDTPGKGDHLSEQLDLLEEDACINEQSKPMEKDRYLGEPVHLPETSGRLTEQLQPPKVDDKLITDLNGGGTRITPFAAFNISDIRVNPIVADKGEVVTIYLTVTNTSHVSSYFNADLKINGTTTASQQMSIDPGESKWPTFTVIAENEGEYTVEIAGLKGRYIVT
jgi:hypothetical protein